MKRTFLILSAVAIFIAACGGGQETTTETTIAAPVPKAMQDNGAVLIKKSDCIGCHRIDTKVIGPSYQDIAAKYPATEENISAIANHIINGSTNIWGSIPMTPHPKISNEEAKEMVKYILSLKKQ